MNRTKSRRQFINKGLVTSAGLGLIRQFADVGESGIEQEIVRSKVATKRYEENQ